MSTVTEGYTIVCFVYGWTDNYRCTYLPKGVVKKYRPSKGKHSNPLRNIYKIVWAFLFLFFFFQQRVRGTFGMDGIAACQPCLGATDCAVGFLRCHNVI